RSSPPGTERGIFSIQKPRLPIRNAFAAPALVPSNQTKTSSRTASPEAEGATKVPKVITAAAKSTSLTRTFSVASDMAFGELVAAMKLPLAGATLFAVLILLKPGWFRGLLRLVPGGRARRFAASVIDSASAYSGRRRALLLALLLAVVGQVTTTLMYFANAMSLATENVRVSEVLFAAAVMTFGTFVAPSAS